MNRGGEKPLDAIGAKTLDVEYYIYLDNTVGAHLNIDFVSLDKTYSQHTN